MPGTWGTLASLIVLLIPSNYFFYSLIFLILFSFVVSIPIINKIEKEDKSDPSYVVIDEAIGMWFILLFDFIYSNLYFLGLSVILFRLFDIWKPYPISLINKQKGAIFVMLDDLIAALFSIILLLLIYYIIQ
jgi:phosphatidylglycerophosphatase A